MLPIFGFLRKNKFFIFGFFILAIVLAANIFPRGYVFSGGDTAQFIEAKNNLYSLFYNWGGRAFFYYGIFYLLDWFGISDTAQMSWYLGIYLVGAYVSFGVFSRLVFRARDKEKFFVSLFYALNLYTLFVFTGNTGFSYYPTLYIFIPVLVGLFFRFVTTENNIYGAFFVLVSLIGSSGFGNPAFFLSFLIFLFLIFVFLAVLRIIIIRKKLIIRLTVLFLLFFLINSFWLLPVISSMRSGVEKLATSNVLEFDYVIRDSASPIMNTISLILFSGDYFPDNFPYNISKFFQNIFYLAAFLPIIIITFGFIRLQHIKDKKIFLAFGGILLIMIMLSARVVVPFDKINHYLYGLWGMQTLRGFDKTGIYIPFLLATLLLLVYSSFSDKKWLTALFVIVVLIPLPFYTGKIQQNMSYRFTDVSAKNKDYRKSKLSFLVKIPDQYYKIRDRINNDPGKFFVATLPYSSNDGSGIANFPKWKMYGVDITRYLYGKKMMTANENFFPGWSFAKDFSELNTTDDNGWIVKLLGIMSAKYIIFHKDVPDDAVKLTQWKMNDLEKAGLISKISDNDYFALYGINKDYVIPYISWQDENVDIDSDIKRIDGQLDKIRDMSRTADFSEINPEKFEIRKTDGSERFLVLAEPFSNDWRAYAVGKNGQETEIKNHQVARGYANGWVVPDDLSYDKILVEYYPARLMWQGIYLSLATALFLLIYLISYTYGPKKSD